MIKKLFTVLALCCFTVTQAQDQVTFEFSDGIASPTLKAKMERQVSILLSAINTAASRNYDINYTGIDIDDNASGSLGATWNNVHFRTEDDLIIDHCLTRRRSNGSIKGYQVRNIGMTMIPFDESNTSEMRRELCIDFNTAGRIVDINFSIEKNEYIKQLRLGEELGDFDRRLQIINWCEQFKKAYNDKDITFMENIFSDDALIITGRRISGRQKSDIGISGPQFEYIQQTKAEYLTKLRGVFNRQKHNGYIKVIFSDYSIKRDGAMPDFYYVTLKQEWNSRGYSDVGTVTLVWDFRDEDHPKIQVRAWQHLNDTTKLRFKF